MQQEARMQSSPWHPAVGFPRLQRSFQPSAQGRAPAEPSRAACTEDGPSFVGFKVSAAGAGLCCQHPAREQQHPALLCQRAAAAPAKHLP